jgi:ELWxxDGT repeat protein
VVSGAVAFFAATDSLGRTLWVTDGTSSGTQRLATGQNGLANAYPSALVPISNGVAFAAVLPGRGRTLFSSDGTPEGTQPIFAPQQNDFALGDPAPLGQAGASLVAVAQFDDAGQELLLIPSDGGVWAWLDLWPGPSSARPTVLASLPSNRGLLLSAEDGDAGREAWVTDGTREGTHRLADLTPGPASTLFGESLTVRDEVFFVAQTAEVGRELFRTDGVTTRLVADLAPGPLGSSPTGLLWYGSQLVFSATDLNADGEPYVVALSPQNDNTPPQVTGHVSGALGSEGWYTSDVTVWFEVFEPDSPVTLSGCEGGTMTTDTRSSKATCVATSVGGTTSSTVEWRRDTVAPTITCPQDLSLTADADDLARATWAADIQDAFDPAPVISASLPSGSAFSVGRTTVVLTGRDHAGLRSQCRFDVLVNRAAVPVLADGGTDETLKFGPSRCGCGTGPTAKSQLWLLLMLVAVVIRRRGAQA